MYTLPYRPLPHNNLFQQHYFNSPYIYTEYQHEFHYYQHTPINHIEINEHHFIPWVYFNPEGINYLLPQILINIQNNIENVSLSLQSFILEFCQQQNIMQALHFLNSDEINILKHFFEWLLMDTPDTILSQFNQNSLYENIQYLSQFIK